MECNDYTPVQEELEEINELLKDINHQPHGQYDEDDIEDSVSLRPIWIAYANSICDSMEGRC